MSTYDPTDGSTDMPEDESYDGPETVFHMDNSSYTIRRVGDLDAQVERLSASAECEDNGDRFLLFCAKDREFLPNSIFDTVRVTQRHGVLSALVFLVKSNKSQ